MPILDIYRKYYGWKVMSYLLVTFYITMAAAGYVVEFLFAALGIIPQNRHVAAITEGMQWNYTTVLNIVFFVITAVLVIRFLRTGGPAMLKMMSTPASEMHHHEMHEHGAHHPEMSHHQMHHGEVEPQYPTPYEHHESRRAEHHQSPHDVVGTEPCTSQQ